MEKQKPNKAQVVSLMVAPFPALVFFKFWSASGREAESLLAVACAMLAYLVLIIGLAYRWDKPSYFDWAVTAYFILVTVSLVVWRKAAGAFFIHYATTGIYACLFAAAFFPPIMGKDPFTYHYAKKYTPEEVWGHPIFVTINRIMTYFWAGIFAACIALSLYPSVVTRAAIPVALILGFGLPFNLRFPNYYLKRLGLPSIAEQRLMAIKEVPAGKTPPPGQLPSTAWEAVSNMPLVFNSEAAGDMSAVIEFVISSSETFSAFIEIENGTCSLTSNPSRKPDLSIQSPAEIWLAISRNELDGQKAFMEQAFEAKGNLGILVSMSELFSGPLAIESTLDEII